MEKKLRVLKLGWEFPPHSYGGLGVACEGLVRGLTSHGVEVLLVLPRHTQSGIDNCHIIGANEDHLLQVRAIDSLLTHPYLTSQEYYEQYIKNVKKSSLSIYGEHIFAEIERYAKVVRDIVMKEEFDIIHAHDWMSFKAGVLAKKISGRPLIAHIHATEFDRTGGNGVSQKVYDLERWGMQEADRVIAVSEYTKSKIVEHYGVDADKIAVLYNAIDTHDTHDHHTHLTQKNGQLVLFLGRLTLQKGPDYFVSAAQKILKHRPDAMFVVAGGGDMEQWLIEWVAASGYGDKILFTGQLDRADVQRAYRTADVFVMPSVSEPFGLTALEAMQQGTPVILSKQSGVSEVVTHALKVDFWDMNELVNKVIAVLDYQELRNELKNNAYQEVRKFSWQDVGGKCVALYWQCLDLFKGV